MKSISLLLGGLFMLAGFNGASAHTNSDGTSTITLSEYRLDMPGSDTEEFVELIGIPGESLDFLSFVILGDGAAGSGVVETAVDMSGFAIDANGYFVLAKSTFTLGVADLVDDTMSFENSDNVTYMLIRNFLGAVGDDLDTNDDGTLDGLTGLIADSLSIIESVGTGDLVYGFHSIGPDGTFVPASGWTCGGVWTIGSFSDFSTNTPNADNYCVLAGDDCSTAAPAALGANLLDTTANTTSGLDGVCSTSTIHNDTFFTYTAGSSLDHSFATCGSDFDTKIRVYDTDCAGACLAYNDDACAISSGQNWASEVIVSLTAGQTVIVQVGGWGSGDAGTGSLTVSEIIPGNDCADALPAALGATPFDTSINTTSGLDGVCSTSTIHNDVFFSYTAGVAGDHSIATCGSDIDTKIRAYDTDCAGACLAYNDDACALSSGQNWASEVIVTLTAGQTVIVQVGGWGSGDAGTGSLTITELGGPPPNDTCAGAVALAVGANAMDSTAATTSGEAGCTTVNKDLWFSYTAGRDGDHTFDTCAASGDSKMAVFDGACGALVCLGSNDDSCGLLSSVTVPMTVGQTVLVQAGAWGATGSIVGDLTVGEPSLCDGNDDGFSAAFDNHDCASAGALPNGLFAMVVCKDRPDFYTFVVEAGATMRAEAQFDTSLSDLDMFLYDAASCSDDQNSGCGGSLACGFSGSNNESFEWTNTTGADMVCTLRVNVWPNDSNEIGGYVLGLGGTLDANTTVFCAPANANSTGGSVSMDTSTTFTGDAWLNATGGPDGEFGFMIMSGSMSDPGVAIADGILCLTGQIGRYNSGAGVNFPARDSTGAFAASPTGGSSVFFTSNANGLGGGPGFVVPAELPFPPGGLVAPGDVYHFQLWYRDGASSNFSDGMSISF